MSNSIILTVKVRFLLAVSKCESLQFYTCLFFISCAVNIRLVRSQTSPINCEQDLTMSSGQTPWLAYSFAIDSRQGYKEVTQNIE